MQPLDPILNSDTNEQLFQQMCHTRYSQKLKFKSSFPTRQTIHINHKNFTRVTK